MAAWNRASALSFQEQERDVRRDFWTALKRWPDNCRLSRIWRRLITAPSIRRPLCACAVSCSRRLSTSSFDGATDR